jgi:hypothetical protein
MKRGADTWIFVSLLLLLFVGGYFAAAPHASEENRDSTTWNPDPNGVRAFYTLLGERLGYRVAQLRKPYDEIPHGARVMVVVQPTPVPRREVTGELIAPDFGTQEISGPEVPALMQWVRRGGAAIFFSDEFRGIPAEFTSTRRIGRGAIYTFDSRAPITNRGMRDYRNALTVLRIIDRHAGKRGLILFDEYHHGFAESRPLLSYVSRQVWIAMGILLVAGLILCHTRGKRFGAVRHLPASETVRPGFEFVEAVARLYQRAGAIDLARDILRRHGNDL